MCRCTPSHVVRECGFWWMCVRHRTPLDRIQRWYNTFFIEMLAVAVDVLLCLAPYHLLPKKSCNHNTYFTMKGKFHGVNLFRCVLYGYGAFIICHGHGASCIAFFCFIKYLFYTQEAQHEKRDTKQMEDDIMSMNAQYLRLNTSSGLFFWIYCKLLILASSNPYVSCCLLSLHTKPNRHR